MFKKFIRVLIKWTLLAFLIGVGVFFCTAMYVDRQLAKRNFSDAYTDCHKIWSARGLYGEEISQNSMASFAQAFAAGARGAEVDVFYDVGLDDFIVSHDFPYHLKNGQLLGLGELFAALGEGHYFWLDFKNLRNLNRSQVLKAVACLNRISGPHKQRIYVEGSNPTNLAYFKRANFNTILDTHPEPAKSILAPAMISAYKMLYYFGGYTVMAMKYGDMNDPVYGPKTRRRLGHIPVFLYHLPVDPSLVDDLLASTSVRVILVGRDQSLNLHHKNACSGSPE